MSLSVNNDEENDMREALIMEVMQKMLPYFDNAQPKQFRQTMVQTLYRFYVTENNTLYVVNQLTFMENGNNRWSDIILFFSVSMSLSS